MALSCAIFLVSCGSELNAVAPLLMILAILH
jgi:hypothetical protein